MRASPVGLPPGEGGRGARQLQNQGPRVGGPVCTSRRRRRGRWGCPLGLQYFVVDGGTGGSLTAAHLCAALHWDQGRSACPNPPDGARGLARLLPGTYPALVAAPLARIGRGGRLPTKPREPSPMWVSVSHSHEPESSRAATCSSPTVLRSIPGQKSPLPLAQGHCQALGLGM